MFREAVGVFDDPSKLNAAVAEMETTAFPRDAISVLGKSGALKKEFGMPYIPPAVAEDNPDAPRDILVRPEEKVIGTSALAGMAVYGAVTSAALVLGPAPSATSVAATLLAGAIIAVLALLIASSLFARRKRERDTQMQAGGMVLWVRTPDEEQENTARAILSKHGAKDVHVHSLN